MLMGHSEEVGYGITVVRLSDVIREEGSVRLVKLDVEGFELEVLMGMEALFAWNAPPMLIVEHSAEREVRSGGGANAVYDHLMRIGRYRIFRGTKSKERVSGLVEVKDRNGLPKHDNIYCFTEHHLTELEGSGLFHG